MQTFQDELFSLLDEDQRRDLAEHGADAGWPGLTYYSDTDPLYQRHETELWEWLADDAEAFGYDNVAAFMASFVRSDMLSDPVTQRCLIVWYGAERCCLEFAEAEA